jgi:hypothetical protein
MRWNIASALAGAAGCLILGGVDAASAQCSVPNQISNGQVADATLIMGNFNAVLNCLANPSPTPNIQISGPSGGIITLQNPGATTNYNLNLPATPGNVGDLLTSGGGSNALLLHHRLSRPR